MTEAAVAGRPFLVCRSGACYCALSNDQIIETMRPLPLPVQALPATPPFILGVATIRGCATPVVDCARLLGTHPQAAPPARLVTIAIGGRQVAIALDEVLGVRHLGSEALTSLPPLIEGMEEGAVAQISTLDNHLLLVLSAARLIPDELWPEIMTPEEQA
jgi:purine-binding chemotaxis protein CheW